MAPSPAPPHLVFCLQPAHTLSGLLDTQAELLGARVPPERGLREVKQRQMN